MGLSVFEKTSSSSPPYCSSSIDRSLTTRLIELSNSPLKSSSRFSHTPDWVDGLDIWSSSQNSPIKTDLSRRNLDFHTDIGLYLPRYEKPKSAPICLKNLQINPKTTTTKTNLAPERIRHLLKKEKDLLSQNNSFDQQSSNEISPQVPTNTFRSATSFDLSSTTNDISLPIRHVTNKSSDQQLNQDALKTLLEEHLTSLLTRGASTINSNRTTTINVPSVDIKQQIRKETKSIDERRIKHDEINCTPLSSTSSQQIKSNQTSHFIIHQRSPLGLTVTPIETSSQRKFSSFSLEKLNQQKTFLQDNDLSSNASSSRPSTEPVSFPPPPPTHRYQQQQKVVLKRNLDTTHSSSGDLFISSNENSPKLFDQTQAIQNTRKGLIHHGSSPKSTNQRSNNSSRTTTIELLPPIVSGKRLHISLANHRYL